jgi:hypothetical protein
MNTLTRLGLGLLAWAAFASSAASEVRVRYFKGQPTFISAKAGGVVQVALAQPRVHASVMSAR